MTPRDVVARQLEQRCLEGRLVRCLQARLLWNRMERGRWENLIQGDFF